MKIKVMKFGGTSVATDASRTILVDKIRQNVQNGYKVIAVVSAMGRLGQPYATDSLLGLLPSDVPENAPERDLLQSCGETISSAVITSLLNVAKIRSLPLMGFQAGIVTDSHHGDANVLRVDKERVNALLCDYDVLVVTGFQGMSQDGFITTLGRGGSDYTASILGVAFDAESIEIFTDVDGVMTADPRVVKEAKVLKEISHSEVYQMAVDGAKVVDHKAVEFAMKAGKPLVIKNTFSEEAGTVIKDMVYDITGKFIDKGPVFTAITSKNDMVMVSVYPENRDVSINEKMMSGLESAGVDVDMINFFTNRRLFVIHAKQYDQARKVLDLLELKYELTQRLSKVTAIGANMRYVPSVSKSVLRALSNEDIEILQAVETSSTVACLVHLDQADAAVNVLHRYYAL